MSYGIVSMFVAARKHHDSHTNDRRYESNDSREMLNGSFSLSRLRCVLLVVAVLREDPVWPQKVFFSCVGDGGKHTPESLISVVFVSALIPRVLLLVRRPTAQLVLCARLVFPADIGRWPSARGLVVDAQCS
jgi:hypothetical protein